MRAIGDCLRGGDHVGLRVNPGHAEPRALAHSAGPGPHREPQALIFLRLFKSRGERGVRRVLIPVLQGQLADVQVRIQIQIPNHLDGFIRRVDERARPDVINDNGPFVLRETKGRNGEHDRHHQRKDSFDLVLHDLSLLFFPLERYKIANNTIS